MENSQTAMVTPVKPDPWFCLEELLWWVAWVKDEGNPQGSPPKWLGEQGRGRSNGWGNNHHYRGERSSQNWFILGKGKGQYGPTNAWGCGQPGVRSTGPWDVTGALSSSVCQHVFAWLFPSREPCNKENQMHTWKCMSQSAQATVTNYHWQVTCKGQGLTPRCYR